MFISAVKLDFLTLGGGVGCNFLQFLERVILVLPRGTAIRATATDKAQQRVR